jgi:methylated-DNA-[protein]-cysteine S-methyltransferase
MRGTEKSQRHQYVYKWVESPIGRLKLVGSDAGLAAILWDKENPRAVPWRVMGEADAHPVLVEAARQLAEYFAGERKQFELPLDFVGTDFQRQVWRALRAIPFGQTRSYRDIARQIGHPKAVRAVGAANGRNPIAIIAPCHRVIGSNGKLTGYGGGLPVKAHLLALEARHAPL